MMPEEKINTETIVKNASIGLPTLVYFLLSVWFEVYHDITVTAIFLRK